MEQARNKKFQRNDVYSKRIRAGKRRTYFFDVRTTRGNDYYLTITESKKRFHDDGYERHKVFIYKEDFNKFLHTLEEVVDHIKTNLMPEYDFDTFTREAEDITNQDQTDHDPAEVSDLHEQHGQPNVPPASNGTPDEVGNSEAGEEVMRWE